MTIITTAVPTISAHFHSTTGYVWIGSAYMLGSAALGICESLLLALTDRKLIPEKDARDLLTDVVTTHGEAETAAAASDEPPLTSAPAAGVGAAPARDWFAYLTFFMALASFLLLLYIAAVLLPTLSRRVNNLAAEPELEPAPRSLASRLRPTRSPGLREDRYEDDEDDEDEPEDDRRTRAHDDE